MAADLMLDTSLIRPLLWVTLSPKNTVEFTYSGRKRITNVSVDEGDAGDARFPLMMSELSSCNASSKECSSCLMSVLKRMSYDDANGMKHIYVMVCYKTTNT